MKSTLSLDQHGSPGKDLAASLSASSAEVSHAIRAAYYGYNSVPVDPSIRFNWDGLPERYDFRQFEKLAAEFAKTLDNSNRKFDYFYCAYPPHLFHLCDQADAPTLLNLAFRFERAGSRQERILTD